MGKYKTGIIGEGSEQTYDYIKNLETKKKLTPR